MRRRTCGLVVTPFFRYLTVSKTSERRIDGVGPAGVYHLQKARRVEA